MGLKHEYILCKDVILLIILDSFKVSFKEDAVRIMKAYCCQC